MRPVPKHDYEVKLLQRIDEFGWSVTSVADAEPEFLPFSYSIGIFETLGRPEALVIGRRAEVGHWMINEYGDRSKRGEVFDFGRPYGGFLRNFDVAFIPVDAALASESYTRSARWLYSGTSYPLVQIVWPDLSGNFPWQPGWPEALSKQQPMLGPSPHFGA